MTECKWGPANVAPARSPAAERRHCRTLTALSRGRPGTATAWPGARAVLPNPLPHAASTRSPVCTAVLGSQDQCRAPLTRTSAMAPHLASSPAALTMPGILCHGPSQPQAAPPHPRGGKEPAARLAHLLTLISSRRSLASAWPQSPRYRSPSTIWDGNLKHCGRGRRDAGGQRGRGLHSLNVCPPARVGTSSQQHRCRSPCRPVLEPQTSFCGARPIHHAHQSQGCVGPSCLGSRLVGTCACKAFT